MKIAIPKTRSGLAPTITKGQDMTSAANMTGVSHFPKGGGTTYRTSMNIAIPKCRGGGVSVALRANYYKVGVTGMIDTAHHPYGGILRISKCE